MADLSAVIDISADATGVETGIGTAKKSISGFRAAVAEAGKASSDSLAKAGDGATAAAEKVDAATRRQVVSLQRRIAVVEAAGKGEREFQEILARQRGANLDVLKPYLDQLDAVKIKQVAAAAAIGDSAKPLERIGISAAQTAAALRGVPAQLTDIVVSLQGGQNVLTVLLQQGGQLKDMFGGVGNAATALSGYVLGLVSPLTLVAAAVALVGAAYYNGAREAEAYNKAIILSGNVSGVTVGQLQAYARSMAEVSGTQGAAAEALAVFVTSSKVGGANLQQFAQSAIAFNKATGQAIGDTAKQFAELGKAPVEASLKLDEQYGHLTTSVYLQIKALQDQGRAVEAADLAQKAFSNTLDTRSTQIMENLGTIERGWLAIKKAIAGAVDAASNIGRGNTNAAELASLQQQLQDRQARGVLNDTPGAAASFDKGNENLRQRIAYLSESVRLERRTADEQARQAVLKGTLKDFEASADQFETNASKRQKEIAKAKTEGQILINAGLKTEADLREQIANIEKKYASPASSGESEAAGIKARTIEQQRYLALLRSQGAEADKLTDGEKLVIKIKEELSTSISGVARAEKLRSLAAAEGQAVVDKQVAGELKRIAGLERSKAAYAALIDQTTKTAEAIGTQADELAASNAVWGQGKVAVEQYRLALMNAKLAEVEGGSDSSYDPAYVASLRLKVAEQQRLVTQAQIADYKTLNQQAQEYARSVTAEAAAYADEAQLAGLTTLERNKILAVRKVELEVAKRLADIDRSGASESDKQSLRDSINATALQDKQLAVAKVVADEWNKTSDSINQSLTDALLRGFESGKDAAANLRDTVVNMFKTLVLRPVISAVLSPVSQAASSLLGGGSGSGLLGSIANAFSTGSSIYGAITTGFEGALGSAVASVFGSTAGNAAIAASISGSASAGAAAASAASIAGGGTAAGAGFGAGIGSALAAIPGWGWALAGAAVLASMDWGGGGGGKTGTVYGTGVDDFKSGYASDLVNGNFQEAPGKAITSSIESGFATYAAALGDKTSTFQAGVQYAMDNAGSGDAQTQLQVVGSVNGVESYNRSDRLGGVENVARGEDALKAAVADESLRAIYSGLQASNIPQQMKDYLAAIDIGSDGTVLQQRINEVLQVKQLAQAYASLDNNLSKVFEGSTSASQALFTLFGGLDAFSTKFTAYYQNFYTEAERSANTFKDLGATFASLGLQLPTTRDAYRALVDSQDLTTESGRAMYTTLLGLADAFASITPSADDAATALADAAKAQADAAEKIKASFQSVSDSLVTEIKRIKGEVVGGGQVGYAYAQSQFAVATAQANAGDQTAAAALPGLSKAVLDLAKTNAGSALELATVQAQILASLEATNSNIVGKYGLTVPSFAVGTNDVPQDMLAQIHKGERIVPAADNRQLMERLSDADAGGAARDVLLRVEQLLVNISAETRATAVSSGKVAKVLERVTPGGDAIATREIAA